MKLTTTEDIPVDISADEISMSVAIFENAREEVTVDKKFNINHSITRSKINLGKLRNRQSTDDLRLTASLFNSCPLHIRPYDLVCLIPYQKRMGRTKECTRLLKG